MNKTLLMSGMLGASAIALGAYAAHGLEDLLATGGFSGEDLLDRVEIFTTASRYQLMVAITLLAIGLLRNEKNRWQRIVWLLSAGVLVFSGLLYVLAFAGDSLRWLGAIVPLGGLAMIFAWGIIAWIGFRNETIPISDDQSSPRPSDENLIRVEELLSHQQHLMNDLNQVVTSLRQEVDARDKKIDSIERTVKRLVELQQAAEDLPNERPPHY